MTARRITQETLGAVLQEKATRYHADAGAEAVGEALGFKPQDLLRAVPRSRAEMFEEVHGDSRCALGGFLAHSRDPGRGGVFPGPAFRATNPSSAEDSYFRKECGRDLELPHPDSQDQVFGPQKLGTLRVQDWKLALQGSWEQHLGHLVAQQASWPQESGCGPSRGLGSFGSSRVLDKDRPGEAGTQARGRALSLVDQEGALLGKGETPGLLTAQGGVGKLVGLRNVSAKKVPAMNRGTPKTQGTDQSQKSSPSPEVTLGTSPAAGDVQFPAQKIPLGLDLKNVRLSRRKTGFDLIDKADVFSRFGIEIIKWAGFHTIKDDVKFSQLFQTLFELETETCAKMLASFKCSLRPEHRDFCFFTIKFLKHSALKTPRVDNEFLNMLLDKGAVKTKNCFFEIIKPFDKYIMRLQDRLLKSVTPLLMACNAYELSVKMKTLTSPLDLAVALETTNSLCRKSLALLGQTFSLASSFRQEKILEAVGLQDIAPSPAAFPNFEDSTLFGREYIEHLKAWLVTSGCPLRVKRTLPAPAREEDKATVPVAPEAEAAAPGAPSHAVPQRAGHEVVGTIDQLVTRIVEGSLSPKESAVLKEDPAYWFLSDENSLEYKYYKLKLAETQRVSQTPRGAGEQPTSVECAVRAMLYARAVRSLKKRLHPWHRRGLLRAQGLRGWKAKRATTGTQTLLSSGTRLKHPGRQAPGTSHAKPALSDGNGAAEGCPPELARACPQDPSPEASGASPKPPGAPETADVALKTMETAEKLARFVAQVGPEIEQFSIENSADNPDLWFLHDQNSSAFKFYRKKVLELCPSIRFTSPADSSGESGEARAGPADPTEGAPEREAPQQEVELGSLEAGPEEDEEGDEDEDEQGPGHAGRAHSAEGSPPADGHPGEAAEDDPAGPPGLTQAASGSCFPRKRVSSKSLKVGMLPAPKRVCLIQEPQVHEPVRIAYDRPRGRPLSKKKLKESDFAQQKLTDKNLGFQMLQRMGWKEGHGLGSRGKGIREPVGMGTASEGEGLGADGQERQEDTFDVFRQRMMQMYRHKRASNSRVSPGRLRRPVTVCSLSPSLEIRALVCLVAGEA
ncbi:SURP and G-patch domain-containing protein 2 isoform X2 [Lepus europaeus]|uniref:SURP and G-patch domain-containing protein 2 isoform X2 n=1 Tax=Lepus europaeus TaxID=9983 RepID=UPI002B46753E|nr:SURP and G-patch domain-containing protein 2 isoform X2 [Lepus europaeus]